MHIALPTYQDADQHIIWWREETAEEWLGSSEEYEHNILPWRVAEKIADSILACGWERAEEPRSGTVYLRRKRF
jgi:hypothetical protein